MVRTKCGEADEFDLRIGLSYRSTVTPFIFVIVMDVFAEIRNVENW